MPDNFTGSNGCRIYVLRSGSEAGPIAHHGDRLHMILVTESEEEFQRQAATASQDPVFLRAEVKIAASYVLPEHSRHVIEAEIQHLFDPARAPLAIRDDLGRIVRPHKWFLMPLPAVNEAIKKY